MAFGSSRLLDAAAERQLVEVRQQLADLRDVLIALPATAPDLATLSASVRQLDELFLIVVVGEFNAGKSAFVNALLGERIFEEGVTSTTVPLSRVPRPPRVSQILEHVTAPNDVIRLAIPLQNRPKRLRTWRY